MRAHVSAFVFAAVGLTACGPDYDCGVFVYSASEERCVCPPGFVENAEFTACVAVDAGAMRDGGVPDASACVPSAEQCNGIDDDCDGVIDGAEASVACGSREGATALACVEGECVVATCALGAGDCDGDAANGCEARLDTLAHCGVCGTTCGWQCDSGTCNDAIAISGAGDHQCVLLSSGRAACWGANERGQLGIGEAGPGASRAAPTYVVGPSGSGALTDVRQVVTGTSHTCARTGDGQVWCWGANHAGQLGDSTTLDRTVPVRASGVSPAVDLSLGSAHTCAALESGGVLCWGANNQGQLGYGDTAARLHAVAGRGLTTAVAVSGMGASTCARLMDGGVRCWGDETHGVLGHDGPESMNVAVSPVGLSAVEQLVVGRQHACALRADGSFWCWGSNYNGQFTGVYDYGAHFVPFEIAAAPSPERVFAALGHTFLVDAVGRAFEAGDSEWTRIAGEAGVRAVALGGELCLMGTAGGVRCRTEDDASFFDVAPPP